MTIERKPHPVFAAVWGALVLLMIAAGVIGLRGHWQGWFATGVLAAIAGWEAVAVVYRSRDRLRDTLSEITTYTNRYLSKHRKPLQGWNTLVAIQALALGRLTYVVAVFFGGPEVHWYALTVAGLFAFGQHAHWLNPGDNG
jgi:hypothetical protein